MIPCFIALRFELHLDFTGIVWAMLNLALLIAAGIVLLICAIVAQTQRHAGRPRYGQQPAVGGLLTGALGLLAGGIGIIIITHTNDHDFRNLLDILAIPWVLIVGGVSAMLPFIRKRMLNTKKK